MSDEPLLLKLLPEAPRGCRWELTAPALFSQVGKERVDLYDPRFYPKSWWVTLDKRRCTVEVHEHNAQEYKRTTTVPLSMTLADPAAVDRLRSFFTEEALERLSSRIEADDLMQDTGP